MKNLFSLFLCISIFVSNSAFSHQIISKETPSYISIYERTPGNYSVLYCKSDAETCIYLGPKEVYTLKELKKLKTIEQLKGTALSFGAAVAVLFGTWVGAVSGGVIGLKYLASATAIDAVAGFGGAIGLSITSTGVALVDRLNPMNRFQIAGTISNINKVDSESVADLDKYAMWLNSQLNQIK